MVLFLHDCLKVIGLFFFFPAFVPSYLSLNIFHFPLKADSIQNPLLYKTLNVGAVEVFSIT